MAAQEYMMPATSKRAMMKKASTGPAVVWSLRSTADMSTSGGSSGDALPKSAVGHGASSMAHATPATRVMGTRNL